MDRICESPITNALEFTLHPKCSSQAEITRSLTGASCFVLFRAKEGKAGSLQKNSAE